MKSAVAIISMLLAVASVSFATYVITVTRDKEPSAKEKALDDFCRITALSVASDMRALRSGIEERQELARIAISYERFNHGDLSVMLCLGERMPESEGNLCLITKDYKCLADRAERLHKLFRN